MTFDKFRVLVWKNWTLQKRKPISGTLQILFPIIVVVLATWARNTFGNLYELLERTEAQVFELKNFTACTYSRPYDNSGKKFPLEEIHFAPNNSVFTTLINNAFGDLPYTIIGHATDADLRDAIFTGSNQKAGVILETEQMITTELPSKLDFDIILLYYMEEPCELMIQNELESAFLKSKNIDIDDPIIRAFPYENIFKQIFTELMTMVLPFFLLLSTIMTVSGVLKSVSSEQKNKVKELMKIMGLSKTLHWLSWYTKWMMMSIISYIFVTLVLCIPIIGSEAILSLSNFFLIWLFFVLYCSSVITFCFVICVLFQRAPSVDGIGSILFFTTYIPYYVYGSDFVGLAYAVKWLMCLPVNTSLGIGVKMALNMNTNLRGITFSNLFTHLEGFQFSFGEVLICLILSTIIHIIITVYIEMVFPGDVGMPKPWYFPFQSCLSLVKRGDQNKIENHDLNGNNNEVRTSENFEEEPKHLTPTVRLENLTKYFGSNVAVDKLSLNMYQDQIFVLCGHNGAGKTTAMSMLIGMIPPTSGTAYINGLDIVTDIEKARNSIGICPQQNILFDDLTVREHIIFFCRLKGMSDSKKINEEVQKYVKILELTKNVQSKTLSGGQKRRLSIANALCGQSTFVILDEPTSGLDVKARRNLWDLLIEEKKGRTIFLSTHYMEEAEVLSDRIAIMNEGKLKTIGTSFFLKKKFGSGYQLIVVKKNNCRSSDIKSAIQKFAPEVSISSEEQKEVTFTLSEEYLDKFDKIFKHLEDNAEELKIESFGCSISTLEEVFLKVGVDQVQKEQNGHETIVKLLNPFVSTNKVSRTQMFFNQIYAMVLKKIHYTRRNLSPYIFLSLVTMGLIFAFLAAPTNLESNFELKLTSLIDTNQPNASRVTSYKSLFRAENVEIINENIRDFVYGNFLERNLKYEIGVSFDENPISVWFNSYSGMSSFNYALNYYHRAVLKSVCTDCDIRMKYDYYRYYEDTTTTTTTESSNEDEVLSQFQEILIYILFLFVLTYWPSIHIIMRVKERVTKAKLLQFISGANRILYTIVTYLMDVVILMIVLCIVLGIVAAMDRSGFNTSDDIILYFSIFSCYSLNIIAWIYLLSFFFKNPLTGESAASYISFGFYFLYAAYAILYHAIPHKIPDEITSTIYWIGIFFAPFSLINIYEKIQVTKFVDGLIWDFEDGIGINLVMMSVGAILFMSIVLMKDFLVFTWIRYKIFGKSSKNLPLPNPTGDDDVQREIERVKSKNASQILQSNLVLDGLSKFYGNNLAVNQLHVSVEPAECFGILGVNGAGKTTTFKMMTGDEMISAGEGYIHGFDLKSQIPKIHQKIGYCPQFDALLPDLSGRETMKIFCLLRGIPNDEIPEIIEIFAAELGFVKHLDKQVENFSGGNKRKLSTALSLIGNLSLVFLDECSSGMDPKAKRQLWDVINKTRNAGKAVILTSHSMQECESLCTKLSIMVDGSFSCLGSIQHLKNKFSKGFVLTIKMTHRDNQNNFNEVVNRVKSEFPGAELKEQFLELLTFHIATSNLKWSSVFEKLATMKKEISISDYTMTQSSLESVFLFFSKQGKRVVE